MSLVVHIPNMFQKLAFRAARKSPGIDDRKRPNIKSIWGRLRSSIPGFLARSKCQFLNHVRYSLISALFVSSSSLFAATANYDETFTEPYTQSDCLYDECACAEGDAPPNLDRPSTLSLGPEFYHLKRLRDGGTKQTGNAIGVRFTYDYIKRYCIYVGAQAFYGGGILSGHTGTGNKIRSRLTDTQIEGSLGYTFQLKCFPYIAFTPFAGYGYFREVNKFTHPSPLQLKYATQYNYAAFGFLSSVYVTPCFTVGLNARFRSPWEARCKVSDDPNYDTLRQLVGDKLQWRIELPLTYTGTLVCNFLEAALVPFYEQRHYGARENFPFDFFETKFKIYGINLQVIYRF